MDQLHFNQRQKKAIKTCIQCYEYFILIPLTNLRKYLIMRHFKEILNTQKENHVNLTRKQVKDEDLGILTTHKVDHIQYMNLTNNSITAFGMRYFCQADWRNLIGLNLYGNKIADKGCKYLCQSRLKIMRWIDLGGNQIGDAGVQHLSKSDWNLLAQIYLTNNLLKKEGVAYLAKANYPKMAIIKINGNKLTPNQQVLGLMLSQAKALFRLYLCMDWASFETDKSSQRLIRMKFGIIEIQRLTN